MRKQIRHALSAGLLLLLCLVLGAVYWATVSQAAPLTQTVAAEGAYMIKALHSGKCIEVVSGGLNNGDKAQQATCNPAALQQQWVMTAVGNGLYKVLNRNSGKALDVTWSGLTDGTVIWQWDYVIGNNQKWKAVAQSDGSYQLIASHSNKCADVSGASTADGAGLVQYSCSGATNQRFTLVPVPLPAEGAYTMKALHTGKCLTVVGTTQNNGDKVQQWGCNATLAQQWYLAPIGDGYYKVLSRNSSKVLDVMWSGLTEGTTVWQWDYIIGNNQKWQIVAQGDGSYQLIAKHSNKCMNINGASTADGADLVQSSCGASSSQRFTLTSIPVPADGVYRIKAVHSAECMEVASAGMALGNSVQQWFCDSSAQHQQWQLSAVGDGYYRLINLNSGKVLEVTGGLLTDGGNIDQWDYFAGNYQKWKLISQSDGSYQLMAMHSNKCANVVGASLLDGTILQQATCSTATNQRFTFEPVELMATGAYNIKAMHSTKCVTVANAGLNAGDQVLQSSCEPAMKHQQWQPVALGNGYYKLINVNSNKVLEVPGLSPDNLSNLQQGDDTGAISQQWKLLAQGSGAYQLVARNSGKCANVNAALLTDGAQVNQYDCLAVTNQRYYFVSVTPPPEAVYALKAMHSNMCVEVATGSLVNGGNVQQHSCEPGARYQQWQLMAVDNGYYKVVNANSGKVLDVAGASMFDGGNVQQWDYTGANSQKWKLLAQNDGSYQIVAVHSNKCLDVSGGSLAEGANIYQSTCHTGAYRRFRLSIHGIESLKGVSIVEDSNISKYVVNRQAAKILGKALFWDMAVSSDGQTACASCHFHAGADVRTKNQLNPGILHLAGAPTNSTYNPTRSGNAGGVNYRMTASDFPTFVLADPNNRDSQILFQTDDVMSSQGVYSQRYVDTTPGDPNDQCALVFDSRFHLGNISTRRVEPRNTPTMINAVFNLRNFWDGRANETFNGVNPFGTRDTSAGIYQFNGVGVSKIQPNLRFSSLASQAVGPPLSDFEMSCAQRLWPNVGRRLLSRYALQGQQVASNDSLLSPYRASNGNGLSVTYQQLIDQAFNAAYRNNSWQVSLNGVNYKLSEANFSFFFGLAVQLYERTLVSDDAPIDRFLSGKDVTSLTAQELRGASIFSGKGKCTSCHSGPQLTNAGSPAIDDFKEGGIVSYMILGDGQPAIYDEGFYNIGVRPTIEDIGVGGTDPFGNPLSFAAQYKKKLQTGAAFVDKNLTVNPCRFEINPCSIPPSTVRTAVDGAFKVPTLRNVELTGPFFHNGSRSTLEQVVEFYNRGGDRRGTKSNNTSGFGSNPSNLDADIEMLGLSAAEKADLVAFLKRPLTDKRVQCDQAPFDHPQLTIPNGHVGNNVAVTDDGTGKAVNEWFTLPAVGANGMCASDMSGRRRTFEEILAANGVLASEAQATVFAETLSMPLTADVALSTDAPVVEEAPVETIELPDAMVVIEDDVAATLVDDTATNDGAYRVYLPQINH